MAILARVISSCRNASLYAGSIFPKIESFQFHQGLKLSPGFDSVCNHTIGKSVFLTIVMQVLAFCSYVDCYGTFG